MTTTIIEENHAEKKYVKNISIYTFELSNGISNQIQISHFYNLIRRKNVFIQKYIIISTPYISNKIFFQDDDIQDYSLYIFDSIENIRRKLANELKSRESSTIVIKSKLFKENNDEISNILKNQIKILGILVFDLATAKHLNDLYVKFHVYFILEKKSISSFKKCHDLPNTIQLAFNFQQLPSYTFNFSKNTFFLLDKIQMIDFNLPFPDGSSKESINYDYTNLRKILLPGLFDEHFLCPNCGAALFNSKYKEKCCNNIPNIRDHMVTFNDPPDFLKEMIENFQKKPNILRLINRCCRPIIQRTSITYHGNMYSTLYLNGVPYAVDSRFQFIEPAFLIFNNFDHRFKNWNINNEDYVNIFEVCKKFLNFNEILKNYIEESLNKIGGSDKYVAMIQDIVDQGMNLAMIESGSFLQKETPLEIIEKHITDDDIDMINKAFSQEDNSKIQEDEQFTDDIHSNLEKMIQELKDAENNDKQKDLTEDQIEDIYNQEINNTKYSIEDNIANEEEEKLDEGEEKANGEEMINDTSDSIDDNFDGSINNENLRKNLSVYKTKQIYAGDSDYDILIYPILFWNGEGGCGKLKDESKFNSRIFRYSVVSMCMQNPSYYFNQCSALKEEFICSSYGRILQLRINYQYNLQKNLYMKKELKSLSNQSNNLKFGVKTYVPTTFTGSYQYWKKVSNQGFYMTLILGPPKFFVTITFNPKWNEVVALNPKNTDLIHNSPLIARIFNQRKKCFLDYIKTSRIFGNINGLLWRVEYQQRGYPHCHILIWSDFDTDDVLKIDKLLTCRLPLRDPYEDANDDWQILGDLSKKYMTHKCTSRCKDEFGNCTYGYPKESCDKTHYENGILIYQRGPNDSLIVPHSPEILAYYRGHVEIEAIHSERCIGYVLKYVSKNSDEADVSIKEKKYCGQKIDNEDYLHKYASSRVVSAVEAFSSLADYNRYGMNPSVSLISIHLPDERIISIPKDQDPETWISRNTLSSSKLERYFLRPIDNEFDDIKLCEYFGLYSLNDNTENGLPDFGTPPKKVIRKKKRSYCSINFVDPSNNEKFALRLLLLNLPARSFDDLKLVDGELCDSFYDAALRRGLVGDDKEYFHCLKEAIDNNRPPSDLRFMIALFAQQGAPLKQMIDDNCDYLSIDLGDIPLYMAMRTLMEQMHMMIPDFLGDEIIEDDIIINESVDSAILNDLQKYAVKSIYEKIVNNNVESNLFFIQGRAGTGKTYTTNVIINVLRKKGYKVLVTGTTGIAATQYEHGMTCHSLFKLKIDQNINGNEFSCNVGYGTYRAKEILDADLIIIDEISMLTIQTAHNIDYTLRSLISHHIKDGPKIPNLENIPPFGGKNILFVGDLLQLPPVVQNSKSSVSNKLITKCSFWPSVKLFGLKDPVRCINKDWNEFLVDIGNGKSKIYITWEELQKKFQITVTRSYKEAIDFFINDVDLEGVFPIDRQWICATNFYANDVNNYLHWLRINENMHNDLGPFYGSTKISTINIPTDINKSINNNVAFDYLNTMKFKDMPNYRIDLALGEPMCLMRNINTAKGMAKNKRCYVIERTQNCVVVEFEDKTTATIPRINFQGETDGIIFTRHQIPLKPIFAGTIHKSQGLTLDRVVVDMRSKFWEHGQLYVALSRIRNPCNLCILLPENKEDNDSKIEPISDDCIVELVNAIEKIDVDLDYVKNWEIVDNEPVNNTQTNQDVLDLEIQENDDTENNQLE